MAKLLIAETDYYIFEVDTIQNRAYTQGKGFWYSLDAVPDYFKDLTEMLRHLHTGFDLLSNNLRLESIPETVQNTLVLSAVKQMQAAGLNRTAVVVPQEEIARMGVEIMVDEIKRAESRLVYFTEVAEAVAWLDGFEKSAEAKEPDFLF
jgi:hypothetical protein